MADVGSAVILTGRAVRLRLRVQPGAQRPGVKGLVDEPDGGRAIRIAVKEPAEGGRANAAVTAMIAEALCVPKRAVTVVVGAADRRKLVEISGERSELAARAALWIETFADGRGGAT